MTTRLRASLVIGVVGLLAVFGCAPSQDAQRASAPMPTKATVPNNALLYCTMRGNGYPLDSAGTINQAVLAMVKQYAVWAVPVSPFADKRPDLWLALKKAAPQQEQWGYVMGSLVWGKKTPGEVGTYVGEWRNVLVRNDALFDTTTGTTETNMAKPGLADSLVDLWDKWVIKKGFDGIFIDWFGDRPAYPDQHWQKAGFTSRAAFESAWRESYYTILRELRARAPKDFQILVNGGLSDSAWKYADGNMWENYPNLNGGLDGLLEHAPKYRGRSVVFTACANVDPNTPSEVRRRRLGQASAALVNAYHCWAPADPNPNPPGDSVWVAGRLQRARWWTWPIPDDARSMGDTLGPVFEASGLRVRIFSGGVVAVDRTRQAGYFWRTKQP